MQARAKLAIDVKGLAAATSENVQTLILASRDKWKAEQDSAAAQLTKREEVLKMAQEKHDRLQKDYQECKERDTAHQEEWKARRDIDVIDDVDS